VKSRKGWKKSKTPFIDMVQGLPGGEGYLSDSDASSEKEEDEEFFILPELLGSSDLKSLQDHCIQHR
jgi:hypothetical protein